MAKQKDKYDLFYKYSVEMIVLNLSAKLACAVYYCF